MSARWPSKLWLVRHGQSSGNVARDAADAAGLGRVDIAERDMEVPLSALGERQSTALGQWFARQPADERPQVILTSTYLRAHQTGRLIADAGGVCPGFDAPCLDERLREREFGILDRLTGVGIREHFPEQAEARKHLGKFYHRPPGGESWCDVILRLRSALDTLSLHHSGQRVMIVGHQVVVLCFRYLLENLSEEEILLIDAHADVANCGLTQYAFDPDAGVRGRWTLERYNFTVPLEAEGETVTTAPDANVAPR